MLNKLKGSLDCHYAKNFRTTSRTNNLNQVNLTLILSQPIWKPGFFCNRLYTIHHRINHLKKPDDFVRRGCHTLKIASPHSFLSIANSKYDAMQLSHSPSTRTPEQWATNHRIIFCTGSASLSSASQRSITAPTTGALPQISRPLGRKLASSATVRSTWTILHDPDR
jgi:hypothetical protein